MSISEENPGAGSGGQVRRRRRRRWSEAQKRQIVAETARRGKRPAAGFRIGEAGTGRAGGKVKPLPATSGQAKLVRAAFAAGVKPAVIARQLRVSRAQVQQVLGGPRPREVAR